MEINLPLLATVDRLLTFSKTACIFFTTGPMLFSVVDTELFTSVVMPTKQS